MTTFAEILHLLIIIIYAMLRKIRVTLALIFWVSITWLLVDFTGTAHVYLGWMAKIQLMPALLSLNVAVLLLLTVLTLLLGRIYCSVICPLGVMQDAIAWFNRKKNKYSYSPAHDIMRPLFVLGAGVALSAGLGWLAGLIFPYSTYGRIVGSMVAPLYKMGNNVLASIAEHYDSYAFYSVDVWMKSAATHRAISSLFFIQQIPPFLIRSRVFRTILFSGEAPPPRGGRPHTAKCRAARRFPAS